MTVRLDPETGDLVGEARLSLAGPGPTSFTLGAEFALEAATLDGRPVPVAQHGERTGLTRWQTEAHAPGALVIRYRGRLSPLRTLDERQVLERLPPMAGPTGSYLPEGSGWYPELPGRPPEQVRLDLPAGQRALVPGRLIAEETADGRYRATFEMEGRAESLVLLAGPFEVRERLLPRAGGHAIRLRTYFHPEVAGLADDYLTAVARYLDLYRGWIGEYPYAEFSVVSSPLPTGFGFPTLTCLGLDVLRLPFIKNISLGHEVLHSWWGHGVGVEWARGNWSEGLTTFMADYAYKEQESAAAAQEMRLAWLQDFAAVPPTEDFPLVRFTARRHAASQVVGYHKAAFLFFMLRDRLGAAAFDEGVRAFWQAKHGGAASWADLRQAFESASRQDLAPFFEQWLTRAGAPRVRIEQASLEQRLPGYRLRLTLVQGEPAYALNVPLRVELPSGEEQRSVDMREARQAFELDFVARPLAVTLDPDFRLFRRLDAEELPPILRQIMLAPDAVTILLGHDAAVRGAALELAMRLLESPPRLLDPGAPSPVVPRLVIGLDRDVDDYVQSAGLPPRPSEVSGRGTAQVWAGREAGRTVVVVSGKSPEAIAALRGPLPHYGRQSYLAFDGARMVQQGVWPARSPEWRFAVE